MIASVFCLFQNALPAYMHRSCVRIYTYETSQLLRESKYRRHRLLRSVLILNFEFICLKSFGHELSLRNKEAKTTEIRRVQLLKRSTLITLVLASALIATAFAAVYYSLTMQPDVTITPATISFAQGADWPTGSTLGANSTWARLALKAYPNATMVYEKPVNISNTDTSAHTFRLRHVSITPATGTASVSNFTFIRFVIRNTVGASQASFNYTTSTDTWTTPSTTGYLSLPASTQWAVYVETKAAANANTNIVANIQIAVDVQ
jgi:hypothetical protein